MKLLSYLDTGHVAPLVEADSVADGAEATRAILPSWVCTQPWASTIVAGVAVVAGCEDVCCD